MADTAVGTPAAAGEVPLSRAERRLRVTAVVFAVAVVVHGADHLRRGSDVVTGVVRDAGAAQAVLVAFAVVLVLRRHRLAALAAGGVGSRRARVSALGPPLRLHPLARPPRPAAGTVAVARPRARLEDRRPGRRRAAAGDLVVADDVPCRRPRRGRAGVGRPVRALRPPDRRTVVAAAVHRASPGDAGDHAPGGKGPAGEEGDV